MIRTKSRKLTPPLKWYAANWWAPSEGRSSDRVDYHNQLLSLRLKQKKRGGGTETSSSSQGTRKKNKPGSNAKGHHWPADEKRRPAAGPARPCDQMVGPRSRHQQQLFIKRIYTANRAEGNPPGTPPSSAAHHRLQDTQKKRAPRAAAEGGGGWKCFNRVPFGGPCTDTGPKKAASFFYASPHIAVDTVRPVARRPAQRKLPFTADWKTHCTRAWNTIAPRRLRVCVAAAGASGGRLAGDLSAT